MYIVELLFLLLIWVFFYLFFFSFFYHLCIFRMYTLRLPSPSKVNGSIKCLFLFSIQQYNKHLLCVFGRSFVLLRCAISFLLCLIWRVFFLISLCCIDDDDEWAKSWERAIWPSFSLFQMNSLLQIVWLNKNLCKVIHPLQ